MGPRHVTVSNDPRLVKVVLGNLFDSAHTCVPPPAVLLVGLYVIAHEGRGKACLHWLVGLKSLYFGNGQPQKFTNHD